jgi:ERCC4-type nuclease
MVVVVDSREQRPYTFEAAVVRPLPTGDYSIEGYEHRIAIERKSKADAYSSLGHKRGRFEREMERLSRLEYPAIVIEASLKDFLRAPEFSRMSARSAIKSLLAWSVKYRIGVFFAGDRRHAQAVTRCLLEKFWRYHGNGRRNG